MRLNKIKKKKKINVWFKMQETFQFIEFCLCLQMLHDKIDQNVEWLKTTCVIFLML